MSEKDSLSPREQKRLADAQTPYLTFLPRQAEGFDPGLHTQTGILTDGGAQPRRWLEDFSLHLDTLGAEEAAFAIPDALAVEQMTRRLLRLKEVPKPDDTADALAIAICHGQMGGTALKRSIVQRTF